jgi:hypothetical protein
MKSRFTAILRSVGMSLALLLPLAFAAGDLRAVDFTAPHEPVYVYLAGHFTDHVNIEMTEDRVRRTLQALERYQKEKPEFHISATFFLTGAVSQVFAERNSKTGIKDLIQQAVRKGLVEVGYDATDEPTYQRRPVPDFSHAKTPQDRWVARGEAVEKLLTEYRDPLTGLPQPGKIGGLALLQEIFGPAAFIDGLNNDLSGDSETAYHVTHHNTAALTWGIPDPALRPLGIHGFRGSAADFGRMMTTGPASSSELYWDDNMLRLSQTSDADLHVVRADDGPAAIQKLMGGLYRNRVRIVQVELSDQRMYLQPQNAKGSLYPPLRIAYNYPNSPTLPKDAFRSGLEIDAAYARQDAVLGWLVNNYFPANTGCRFISNARLREMVEPSTGYRIPMADLIKGVQNYLKHWPANYPPVCLVAGKHYLSMADTFVALTDALAQLHREGKLPESVRLVKVYGPVPMDIDHGPVKGEVRAASVSAKCAELEGPLHDESWQSMPRNTIPTFVTVDGIKVNAAQFMRLMAQTILAPSPDTQLGVRMSYMFSTVGLMFPRTRATIEQGGTWTFKPAPLNLAVLQAQR